MRAAAAAAGTETAAGFAQAGELRIVDARFSGESINRRVGGFRQPSFNFYLRTDLVDIKELLILFCMWGYSPHTPGNAARCIAFFAKLRPGVVYTLAGSV